VPKTYIPKAGDIIWLEFAPHSGREQARGFAFSKQ
jgi:mRNA-degrading endonuclease toxin of MazEF toxin-antitoxin module